MVELLLNHGVREQDVQKALQISIKNCNNENISLLLKKLGLDVANNSICLGGFHLGKIEPSWLHPLFLEKQPTLKQTSIDQEGKPGMFSHICPYTWLKRLRSGKTKMLSYYFWFLFLLLETFWYFFFSLLLFYKFAIPTPGKYLFGKGKFVWKFSFQSI